MFFLHRAIQKFIYHICKVHRTTHHRAYMHKMSRIKPNHAHKIKKNFMWCNVIFQLQTAKPKYLRRIIYFNFVQIYFQLYSRAYRFHVWKCVCEFSKVFSRFSFSIYIWIAPEKLHTPKLSFFNLLCKKIY